MKNKEYYTLNYPELNITLNCLVYSSNRRSISIQITDDKKIIIKIPNGFPTHQLDAFLSDKKEWILKTYQSIPSKRELNIKERHRLEALEKRYRKVAKEYIPQRVAYFCQFTGGSYEKVVIRDQKTRWGSCSSNKTLSFNYRLMLAPPKILDYVVVHELCHLQHMNHSPDFWNAVEKVLPDYRESRKWLKEHGHTLNMQTHLFPEISTKNPD